MFLRRKTKSVRGVGYSYWHLCETVRTARGPRQRVVASLGKLDQTEPTGLRGGWDDLGALLRGEPTRAKTADLPGLVPAASPEPSAQWERADISGLRVERTRDFGESYLALSLWHRLKLDELLGTLLPEGRESVAWAHTAALLTVARFARNAPNSGWPSIGMTPPRSTICSASTPRRSTTRGSTAPSTNSAGTRTRCAPT